MIALHNQGNAHVPPHFDLDGLFGGAGCVNVQKEPTPVSGTTYIAPASPTTTYVTAPPPPPTTYVTPAYASPPTTTTVIRNP